MTEKEVEVEVDEIVTRTETEELRFCDACMGEIEDWGVRFVPDKVGLSDVDLCPECTQAPEEALTQVNPPKWGTPHKEENKQGAIFRAGLLGFIIVLLVCFLI